MNKKCVFVSGLTEEKYRKLYLFLENELGVFDYEVWKNDFYDNVLSLICDKVRKQLLEENTP